MHAFFACSVLDDPEPLIHDLFRTNLARYQSGQPQLNEVNLKHLERS